MNDPRQSYEAYRTIISGLVASRSERHRGLEWVADNVALSRDESGRIELFTIGTEIVARARAVVDLLEYRAWASETGEIRASRLVLPRGSHFDQLAAVVCVELADAGVEREPQSAFDAVEPLIELALRRESIADASLIGLIGELALLDHMTDGAAPDLAGAAVKAWAGSAPSARDFQFGPIGVEVKTTQAAGSAHHVSGVHQVEVGHGNGGVVETQLWLLSLGIAWTDDPAAGHSLPDLLDSILARLEEAEDRHDLLVRVRQYGGDSAIGYDHGRDANKPRFTRRFSFRFERLYDMTDPRVKVLRTEHLSGHDHVDQSSVSFRVLLPAQVRGEINPIVGWEHVVDELRAGLE